MVTSKERLQQGHFDAHRSSLSGVTLTHAIIARTTVDTRAMQPNEGLWDNRILFLETGSGDPPDNTKGALSKSKDAV